MLKELKRLIDENTSINYENIKLTEENIDLRIQNKNLEEEIVDLKKKLDYLMGKKDREAEHFVSLLLNKNNS